MPLGLLLTEVPTANKVPWPLSLRSDQMGEQAMLRIREAFSPSLVLLACLTVALLAGCHALELQWPRFRSQSPEPEPSEAKATRLIGDVALISGRHQVEVEGVGLVVGLPGTGSDPPPGVYRAMLLEEMRKRGVPHPDKLLARSDTALVIVRGIIRPGMRKGDRFDLELRVPGRSQTKSLRGGYLLETRLTEKAVVGGAVHQGRLMALGAGPVMVDPAADAAQGEMARRGRVLGGGVTVRGYSVGLMLRPEFQNVAYSAQVGHAINQRFHLYNRGVKENMAVPKNDEWIELRIHPRYKHNVQRYLQVVRSIALKETAVQRAARLDLLQRRLLDRATAPAAALELEAIGHEAVPVLLRGLESDDPEVRFYAAEALAYLDHEHSGRAAPVLAQVARSDPVLRPLALAALSSMNTAESYEQLRQLLDVRSAQTRYGAFRALWAMNRHDPLVRGQLLNKQFYLHVLPTTGPRMIHLARSFRPEIVLFGADQEFPTPLLLEAGKHILVKAPPGGPVSVSRFAPGKPVEKRQVSPKVVEVIRAVAELGGTYPDVVEMFQQAASKKLLPEGSRLEIDALPRGLPAEEDFPAESTSRRAWSPWPSLFGSPRTRPSWFPSAPQSSPSGGSSSSNNPWWRRWVEALRGS